jgi:two-component system nitrate/nitrite response regulator NarL
MPPPKPPADSPAIRILLVEDHGIVRAGLRMLLENEREMSVVGEAKDRQGAVALAKSQKPEIILLDLDLGGESGLDLIPALLGVSQARILILTGLRDIQAHRRAFQLGAMGLVEKDKAGEVLIKAIRKVHAGEAWMDHAMTASLLADLARAREAGALDPEAAKIAALSQRERQIISLLAEALDNTRIAERLFISEITVRHHLTSIFGKLGVRDRLELLVYAYRHRLAEPPSPGEG